MRSTEKLADRDTYITMPNHAKMHRTVYLFDLSHTKKTEYHRS